MIQRKATIPLQLDGQFDSHLYEGRQVQMVLSCVDRSIGETSIEVERMADVARSSDSHRNVFYLLQIILFREKLEKIKEIKEN